MYLLHSFANMHIYLGVILVLLTSGLTLKAHVGIDYPAGGEIYAPGDIAVIQWQIIIAHEQENWDLYYSTNDGIDWNTLILDLPPSDLTYNWVVPISYTGEARIKIVQDNVDVDYEAVSYQFTIQNPAIVDDPENSSNTSIGFCNCITGYVAGTALFNFSLIRTERVIVEIYDISGRVQASLVNDILSPGIYNLEFTSSRGAGIRQYVYVIRAGEFSRSGLFF